MRLDENLSVTAWVVVASEQGGDPARATASNMAEWMPSSERLSDARRAFRQAGFTVSTPTANSFSISGPVRLFEHFFGGVLRADAAGRPQGELPLDGLPAELKAILYGAGFPEPPAFGPERY
jgi:hypothetical protein